MHGPKGTIYQVLIDLRSALFDGKKAGLNVRQVLAAFSQIILSQFVVKIESSLVLHPFSIPIQPAPECP